MILVGWLLSCKISKIRVIGKTAKTVPSPSDRQKPQQASPFTFLLKKFAFFVFWCYFCRVTKQKPGKIEAKDDNL